MTICELLFEETSGTERYGVVVDEKGKSLKIFPFSPFKMQRDISQSLN